MTDRYYQLSQASIDDCLELSLIFKDQATVTEWGGEGFVFPIQRQQFLLQLHKPDTHSYVLKRQGTLLGFGQICQRFGKHHLARLLISPDARGQRLSYILVLALISRAIHLYGKLDFSLFVFRHNRLAIHCYQQLGFHITSQPGPEHQGLYFMQLSYQQAVQLLADRGWQFRNTSDEVHCRPQESDHANLD